MPDRIRALHSALGEHLRAALPDIGTIECYPDIGAAVDLPAVIFELSTFAPGIDPGTGQLGLQLDFEFRVLVDPLMQNADVEVTIIAARIALALHHQTFGLEIHAGKLNGEAASDPFRPESESYLVWMVPWTTHIDVGNPDEWQTYAGLDGEAIHNRPESAADGRYPLRRVFWGVDPETGIGHEPDYTEAGVGA